MVNLVRHLGNSRAEPGSAGAGQARVGATYYLHTVYLRQLAYSVGLRRRV